MNDRVTGCAFGQGAFRRELQSVVELLGELRRELRAYLAEHAVPADVAADVVLAVQEAAKNAMRARPGRSVAIAVWVQAQVVCVSVKDQGTGLVLADDAPRGCPSAWSTHGRGLYLMRSVMDSVAIDCSDGTSISMRRRLTRRQTA
jgi:anti-sigma regulatory factor (Ser/Thr protein kinase)